MFAALWFCNVSACYPKTSGVNNRANFNLSKTIDLLDGDFKYFSCPSRTLGKMNPILLIFFRWIGSTTQQFIYFGSTPPPNSSIAAGYQDHFCTFKIIQRDRKGFWSKFLGKLTKSRRKIPRRKACLDASVQNPLQHFHPKKSSKKKIQVGVPQLGRKVGIFTN